MIHCESWYGEINQNMVYLMLVQGLKHEHNHAQHSYKQLKKHIFSVKPVS